MLAAGNPDARFVRQIFDLCRLEQSFELFVLCRRCDDCFETVRANAEYELTRTFERPEARQLARPRAGASSCTA